MIGENQLPERYRDIISEQIEIYDQGRSITVRNSIPETSEISLEKPTHWLRIPDVICVFVDMLNSTKLSAELQGLSTEEQMVSYSRTRVL